MPSIVIRNFAGEIPMRSPRLLQSNQSQEIRDVKIWSGELRAWNEHLEILDLQVDSPPTTLYWFNRTYWLHWPYQVHIVRSPVTDTNERIYITGMDFPRVSDASLITQSGSGIALPSYRIGVPAPTTTPSASVEVKYKTVFGTKAGIGGSYIGEYEIGGGDGSTQELDTDGVMRSRAYVETFVNPWGEEGPPGPPSATIDVIEGRYVDITNLTPTPSGDWNLSKRRLYRVNTGSSGAAYQFVVELDLTVLSYHDTILDSDLGSDILSTTDYDLPPDDMRGIIELPNNILAGFKGNEICFCEPGLCYAWPEKYRITTNHPIVALGVFGSTLVILTNANIYLASGIHPANMTMDELPHVYPCVSSRGVVSMEAGVFFPSIDGLCQVTPSGAQIVTKGLFTRDEWQDIKPETMHAYPYGGIYLAYTAFGDASAAHIEAMKQRLFANLVVLANNDTSGAIGCDAIGVIPLSGSDLAPVDFDYDTTTTGLGFYVQNGTLVPFSFYTYCGYLDPPTGNLYLVHKVAYQILDYDVLKGEIDEHEADQLEIDAHERIEQVGYKTLYGYHIKQLDGDTTRKIMAHWKSRKWNFTSLLNWAAVRIYANYETPLTEEQQTEYEEYRQAILARNRARMESDEEMGGSVDANEMDKLAIDDDNLEDVPAEYVLPSGIHFTLICDGEIVAEETITSPEPVRLPAGYRARECEIKVSSEIDIREVAIATSIQELVEVQPPA